MAIFVFFFKKAKSRRQKHQGGTQLVKDRRPLGHVAPEHAARDLHALGGLEIKHPLRKASARGDTAHSNKQHRTNNDQGERGSDMAILYVSDCNAQSCERSVCCNMCTERSRPPKNQRNQTPAKPHWARLGPCRALISPRRDGERRCSFLYPSNQKHQQAVRSSSSLGSSLESRPQRHSTWPARAQPRAAAAPHCAPGTPGSTAARTRRRGAQRGTARQCRQMEPRCGRSYGSVDFGVKK
jgi:hypothetical protein